MLKTFVLLLLSVATSDALSQPSYHFAARHTDHAAAIRAAMQKVSVPDRPHRSNTRPGLQKASGPLSLVWDATIGSNNNSPGGGTITGIASEGDDLYLAGDFLDFDTVSAASMIVHYNKKTGVWDGFDYGPFNTADAIAVHNGNVYLAGSFTTIGDKQHLSVGYIAMWDGSTWHDLGGGMNDKVNALAFVGDELYAGGISRASQQQDC